MNVRVHMTGLGYEYVRCRCHGDDSTIYLHQLAIIADGADPYRVFSDRVDVHHRNHIPWDNRASNLELEDSVEHRVAHLDQREPAEGSA